MIFNKIFRRKKEDAPDIEAVTPAPEQPVADRPVIEPPVVPASTPAPASEPKKQGWLSRLKKGLSKSSEKISTGISDIFIKRRLDRDTLQELEDLLIASDLGVDTATQICETLARDKFDKDVDDREIRQAVADTAAAILAPVARPLDVRDGTPEIILVVGVNGTGKTTTMGKLGHQLRTSGKTVMFAACDTFRAAATEQLQVWGDRAGIEVVSGREGADPAGLAYDACQKARAQNMDVLMIDTAGRLHNKKELMEELAKISRALKKFDPAAPHHVIQVLDATTGQNAVQQVQTFRDMTQVSGLVVTKLDGTAKGGIVVALTQKFNLPIHAIGVGESLDDLQPFDAGDFARQLVGLN